MSENTSFQYPKYTRKLFVQDDETNQVEPNNNISDVQNVSQTQNKVSPVSQNSIANQLYQQPPPNLTANHISNQFIPQQNIQYTPPSNINYMNNSNQVYMPMYQQPMSYMPQQVYQQYPMMSNPIQPPNYVEMMKNIQQLKSPYMIVNSFNKKTHNQKNHTDISSKLTKKGVSLDEYDDGDDKNVLYNSKHSMSEKEKTKKNKVRDTHKKQKPIISYEDTYFSPKLKQTNNKVNKVSSVKSNSFADKYKKLIQSKDIDEDLKNKSSDSDAAPEELKIDNKEDPPKSVDDELNDDSDEDEEQRINFIQGTGISLESEEDITKWQEQRRINWMLKVSNKKSLHNEILKNPENFKDSEDEEIRAFLKFKNEHNISADLQESQKNSFKEFGKIKEAVRKMFQQIEKDDNNTSITNIASMKLIKMEEEKDNLKILPFIKALGDMNKLEYTLTDNEKEKLFGPKR
ncbi:hypothetical protein ACO0R3_003736 [Hanseniaspora guilliermondii]